MILAYLWEELSSEQQKAAIAGREKIGLNGEPPSGAEAVWWVTDGNEWSWKHGVFPNDRRNGIRLAAEVPVYVEIQPPAARKPMPGELWRDAAGDEQRYLDLMEEHGYITRALPPSPGPVAVSATSPPTVMQAPRAKRKGRR